MAFFNPKHKITATTATTATTTKVETNPPLPVEVKKDQPTVDDNAAILAELARVKKQIEAITPKPQPFHTCQLCLLDEQASPQMVGGEPLCSHCAYECDNPGDNLNTARDFAVCSLLGFGRNRRIVGAGEILPPPPPRQKPSRTKRFAWVDIDRLAYLFDVRFRNSYRSGYFHYPDAHMENEGKPSQTFRYGEPEFVPVESPVVKSHLRPFTPSEKIDLELRFLEERFTNDVKRQAKEKSRIEARLAKDKARLDELEKLGCR